jgi:hypothetical protein
MTKITDKLISWKESILCILFFATGVQYRSSSDPDGVAFINLVNIVGGIIFLGWVHAVGHRAKTKLKNQKINIPLLIYFDLYFLAVLLTYLVMFFTSYRSINYLTGNSRFHISVTYYEPVAAAMIFFLGLFLIVLSTAKGLVSAEKSRDAEVSEYFKTLLLLIFPFIGVWFIQDRAKRL